MTALAPLLPAEFPWPAELQVAGQLVGGKRNPNTAEAYARDLRLYFAWCADRGMAPFSARRPDVDAFVRHLEASGASAATVLRRLSTVQQFYEEAVAEDLIDRVPTSRVERPRLDREPSLGIDADQARHLVKVAAAAGPREEAVICLLLLNGLRAGEVAALSVGDLGAYQGKRLLTVTGKRGKTRRPPIPQRTAVALDRQLRSRGKPHSDERLIVRADGSALDRWEIGRITHKFGHQAGIPPRLRNPHELRHAFVTLSLAAGVPLEVVQESAGHVDPKTTFGYKRALESLDRHASIPLAEFLGLQA